MSSENFSFNLLKEVHLARLGKINTHRGSIDTPAFMPVGTQGTVKSVFIEQPYRLGGKSVISGFSLGYVVFPRAGF